MTPGPARSMLVRNLVIAVALLVVVGLLALAWWRGRDAGPGLSAPESAPAPVAGESATGPTARPPHDGDEPRVWPARIDEMSCEEIDERLALWCEGQPATTCPLLKDVAEALAAKPPTGDSGLRDHGVLRANVFHVFRALGKQRILAMRGLAVDAEASEQAALAFYPWAVSRARCAAGETAFASDTAYDYAVWALTTLGGQSFLRRRAPRQESVACYWALQALDRSMKAGHNPQGVDPRPEIDRCRELVRDQPLAHAARYEADLAELALRWESPSGGVR